MLNILNQYNHGYVVTPIIEVCQEHGVFDRLDKKNFCQVDKLKSDLRIKTDYLVIILNYLESLGWLEKSGGSEYRLAEKFDVDCANFSLTPLYAVSAEELVADTNKAKILSEKIEELFFSSNFKDKPSAKFAQSAIILMIFSAMKSTGDKGFHEALNHFDSTLTTSIEKLFISYEWLSKKDGKLSSAGERLLRSKVSDLPILFRPMLSVIKELLFSGLSVADVFHSSRGEIFSRVPNLTAYYLQYDTYYEDLEQKIIAVFDAHPIEQQPKIIANSGCGDGTLLRKICHTIYERTERGKYLEKYPLVLLAIDNDEHELEITTDTLRDLNYRTFLNDENYSIPLSTILKRTGFEPDQKTLQIRNFVDHKVAVNEKPANSESVEVLASIQTGCYLDEQGKKIDASIVLGYWQKHLKSLADNNSNSELLILQAHGVMEQESYKKPESSETSYLDFLYNLSSQYLISAEAFILLAANVGLFNNEPVKRDPIAASFCRSTLHHLSKRDYIIRLAQETDITDLFALEDICWQHLKSSEKRIRDRLNRYPQGQFVLERSGKVVGVIYSQRIVNINALDEHNAANVHKLHDEKGTIIQLLAVNIHPDAQNLNLGDQLLEFMLQRCSVMSNIDKVVGVTLCKKYQADKTLSFGEYIHQRDQHGTVLDPVLSFHDSHGAEIVKALPGYRKLDIVNEGNGVLVQYDIHQRVFKLERRAALSDKELDSQRNTHQLEDISKSRIKKFLRNVIEASLGGDNDSFAMDRPLMEMGLDSANLLKLTKQIREKYKIALKPAFFFQFNTTEKVLDKLVETVNASMEPRVESFSEEQKKPKEPKKKDTRFLGGKERSPKDIAVIGISCRLPGDCNSLDDLWNLLSEGNSGITTLPEGRFNWPDQSLPINHEGIECGGFLEEIAAFDAGFFRISPKEARTMDPQQRIMLELAWHCLENAGDARHSPQSLETGVFIGASGSDYSKLLQESHVEADAHSGTGNSMAILANRISYFFDFSGPSIQIDTACSSSLTAVHAAIQALRNEECQQALVGGVHLICHPSNSLTYYKAGMLATDGKCKTFDAKANGYVRSEGAVMILVKPLEKAVTDRDPIYAVLKGSAVNHGGLSGGLTVPSPQKQAQLLVKAWKDANVKASRLTYLEAHGTGTSLGDPIEIQGMKEAFAKLNDTLLYGAQTCGVGSLKSNLGHLEAAAGIAGLLKVIIAMQKKEIPASINFHEVNPEIQLDESPLYVVNSKRRWTVPTEHKRLAGLSSFGSGGANAHVVVEEWLQEERRESQDCSDLFVISAKNKQCLRSYVDSIILWINKYSSTVSFADFMFTFQTGRSFMEERLAIITSDFSVLQNQLTSWLESEKTTKHTWHKNIKQLGTIEEDDLTEESDVKRIVNALDRKDSKELALLWTNGAHIDFRELYEKEPRIAHVPCYPFLKERHWFTSSILNKAESPIFGEQLPSMDGLVFSKYWENLPNRFFFIQEGFSCLSLGFVFEIFYSIGKKVIPELEITSMSDFEFYPFYLEPECSIRYETRCLKKDQGLSVEIVQVSGAEEALIAEAKLNLLDANPNQFNSEISNQEIQSDTFNEEEKSNYRLPMETIKSIFPTLLATNTSNVLISKVLFYATNDKNSSFIVTLGEREISVLTRSKQPVLSIYQSVN